MADDVVKKTDDANDPFAEVKKELATRFTLLPEEIQKVIIDEKYQLKLFELAKANKLTYEELGELELETTMVLLGMTKPEEYRDELQVQLKKNDPEIDAIVKAVNEQIFSPIRSTLEKVYAAKKDVPENAPAAAPTPTPTSSPQINIIPSTPVATPKPAAPVIPTPVSAPAPAGLSSMEKSVLEKTGVVISETPIPTPSALASQMPARSDLLKGIENPSRVVTPNIVAAKLAGNGMPTQAMPLTKTTDYSVPKPSAVPTSAATPMPTPPKSDPYREPLN